MNVSRSTATVTVMEMVTATVTATAAINRCPMTDDEFKIFRNLIHKECGISLSEARKDFLRTKVEKRLSALNIGSFFQYYKYLTEKNQEEMLIFLDSVTINETYFFRNLPQFEMFGEKVLPDLLEKKRRARDYRLNVWSAGCSTGEEAYSIAIQLADALPDVTLWDVRIIASDISLRCLGLANLGRYCEDKLRDVPPKYLSRYFRRDGDFYLVSESLKKMVTFDYHNLQHENGLENMDVIFCRNVMIYYEIAEQKKLVGRFAKALNHEGYLFLGHAETLQGITTNGDFKFHCWNKGTAYQRLRETHG
ncbi:MAG: CheR family methyltransferase [Thermodesulfovibrionales bacterium]